MRLFPRLAAGLFLLPLLTATAGAEAPPTPLRLIPDAADFLVEVKNPRRLVETFTNLDAVKQLQDFPQVKELMDSTNARRYYQLQAYFEKELGAKRPELLDRLAGGGVALGGKFGDQAPAVLVVQGKDEKLMKKFAQVALDLAVQELERQESKERPVKGTYQDVETVRIGDKFYAAVLGAALVVSNNEAALHAALDLHLGKSKKSLAESASVADAAKLLPPDPLARLWVNMDPVRERPEFKDFYKAPRDIPQTILYGAFVDVLARSRFISVGLNQDKDGLVLSGRLPSGRDGMGPVQAVFLPPEGKPGCRPPLAPKGVLYSESFYTDPAPIWQDRAKLFSAQQVKALEDFDKNSGKFLSGLQMSKFLTGAGPYHRIVVVDQPQVGYKITPKQRVPAFALVSELRDPEEFGRSMETVLRGAGLLASSQVKLKYVEETYKDCTLIGYRFPEDAPFKGDVSDIRFNFSPCFTRVGNQYVLCSTLELCRELVDVLQQEAKDGPGGSPDNRQVRVFSSGAADLVQAFQDQLTTQVILDQAVPPADAEAQVKGFLQWIRGLGEVTAEQRYTATELRYDIRFKPAK